VISNQQVGGSVTGRLTNKINKLQFFVILPDLICYRFREKRCRPLLFPPPIASAIPDMDKHFSW
jgi:hypothetical protein